MVKANPRSRRFPRHRHVPRRLHRVVRGRRRRDRPADCRRRAPQRSRRRRRVRVHRAADRRRGGAAAATRCCSTCTARWSTRTYADGEGELLRRIRAVAPNVPIARCARHARESVSGDRRARRRDRRLSDVSAHRHGRAPRCARGRALLRMLAGEVNPTMAWGNAPMLPHVMRQGTATSPTRSCRRARGRWSATVRSR